uniref:Uncharacterized protein n=1 Tax=Timema genevievae TaxID=629358 RepID=A0A7R9K2H9_TIMGE|nr:unnamed protein product [Timema genevievae]
MDGFFVAKLKKFSNIIPKKADEPLEEEEAEEEGETQLSADPDLPPVGKLAADKKRRNNEKTPGKKRKISEKNEEMSSSDTSKKQKVKLDNPGNILLIEKSKTKNKNVHTSQDRKTETSQGASVKAVAPLNGKRQNKTKKILGIRVGSSLKDILEAEEEEDLVDERDIEATSSFTSVDEGFCYNEGQDVSPHKIST